MKPYDEMNGGAAERGEAAMPRHGSGPEVCVDESALAEPGAADGEAVAPAQGDPVEGSFKGTVTRAEGGKVYFRVSEINGSPVHTGGEAEAGESDEAQVGRLEREAKQMSGVPM